MHRLVFLPAVVLAAAGTLAGCGALRSGERSLSSLVTPYRIEVVQGNVVTREQAAQVRPGMTRSQVREILGSPLLTDIFHADRWDYIFTIRRSGAQPQRRSVIAHFDGERLQRLESSEDLPTEEDFVASIATRRGSGKPPTLELTPEQRAALPAPRPRPEAAAAVVPEAPAGAQREYPPLER